MPDDVSIGGSRICGRGNERSLSQYIADAAALALPVFHTSSSSFSVFQAKFVNTVAAVECYRGRRWRIHCGLGQETTWKLWYR